MKTVRLNLETLEPRETPSASSSLGYDYSRLAVDNHFGAKDISVAPSALGGGLALEGGGIDVGSVYTWLAVHGGHGDLLLIGSASSTSGNYYNNPVKNLLGGTAVNSISTLMVSSTSGANSNFVINTVNTAEAIFLLGGDQSTYINLWKGTGLADAIGAAAARNVPIGGTSAGLSVLGQYIYGGLDGGSAISSTVLNAPHDSSITLVKNFLNTNSEAITQASEAADNTVTIATKVAPNSPTNVPHNFVPGHVVNISGMSTAGYNGTFTILTATALTPTTFSYTYKASQTKLPANTGGGVAADSSSFTPLPYLADTITDSHFYERDRMGRLVTFMANIVADPANPQYQLVDANHQLANRVKGIGVDQETALLIETTGQAAGTSTIVANPSTDPNARHVYLLESPGTLPGPQPWLTTTSGALDYSTSSSGVLSHRGSVVDPATMLPSLWVNMLSIPSSPIGFTSSDYLLETYYLATGATALKKQFWSNGVLVDGIFVY